MLAELNEAKRFLIEKFRSVEDVKPGVYAVPTNTSKGPAFMKVIVNNQMGMSDFSLWLDEELTRSWY
ncbi:hypothetical protein [Chryseobacterium indologenes]|uniref:hypothetical protein n=1 Tax=Chryseobacterium indologenes TaxID=253 RepID=UPI00301B35AB